MRMIISFIVLGALFGIWYFIKKQPNQKYRNISALIALVAFIIFGIFFREEEPKQVTTGSVASSSAPSSSLSSTSQDSVSSSSSSSVSSDLKTSSTGLPKLTNEAGQQFATYLENEINSVLQESGYTVSALGTSELIYVDFPQEAKYSSTVEIQRLADSLLELKNTKFNGWASENGYDTQDKPVLYLRSADHTELAEEGVFTGRMKVKVNN